MNDDDKDYFKKAMEGVRPLSKDTHKPFTSPPVFRKNKKNTENDRTANLNNDLDLAFINKNHWISGEKSVFFHKNGVQPRTLQQLKRGKLPIEAYLDLHGLTAPQAIEAVNHCLTLAQEQACRVVHIVHGKGLMGKHDKPILKNILIDYLHNHQNVLAYASAIPRDGGTGALYILLKRN